MTDHFVDHPQFLYGDPVHYVNSSSDVYYSHPYSQFQPSNPHLFQDQFETFSIKSEPFESNLPSINEVFNEPTHLPAEIKWQAPIYKDFSPFQQTNATMPYGLLDSFGQVEINADVKGADDQIGSQTWQYVSTTPMLEPVNSNLSAPIFNLNSSEANFYSIPLETDQAGTSLLEYQPIYTHSPSELYPINPNSTDANDFFAQMTSFSRVSTSSVIRETDKESPSACLSKINKSRPSEYRTNRNGKLVKKVSQNCHANSQCSNCGTMSTTLWRRSSNGEVECNACNLYYRKNQTRRPVKLQKRGIMRRMRNPRLGCSREESPDHVYNISVTP